MPHFLILKFQSEELFTYQIVPYKTDMNKLLNLHDGCFWFLSLVYLSVCRTSEKTQIWWKVRPWGIKQERSEVLLTFT